MSEPLEWEGQWPGPVIDPGEVHLGRLRVDGTTRNDTGSLSGDELDRASSFHFDLDRNRYISTRGALRSLLGGYLGIEPRSVQLIRDTHGKPLLAEASHRDLHFNVSHADTLIVVAISHGSPIGVDVEEMRTDIPHRDMASRFFSPEEMRDLELRPVDDRLAHFFSIWTRKEAYLKGIGTGLSIPPESFTVTVGTGSPTPVNDPSRTEHWWTSGIDVAEGFKSALALPRDNWTIRPFEIAGFSG